MASSGAQNFLIPCRHWGVRGESTCFVVAAIVGYFVISVQAARLLAYPATPPGAVYVNQSAVQTIFSTTQTSKNVIATGRAPRRVRMTPVRPHP